MYEVVWCGVLRVFVLEMDAYHILMGNIREFMYEVPDGMFEPHLSSARTDNGQLLGCNHESAMGRRSSAEADRRTTECEK